MAYLASLPADAVLLDVFRAFTQIARPLLDYHQAPLRGPSPLAVAERELIAAYLAGLNARGYGYGVHQAIVQTFGIDQETTCRAAGRRRDCPGGRADEARPLRKAVNARWSSSPFGAQRATAPNLSVGGAVTRSMSVRPG